MNSDTVEWFFGGAWIVAIVFLWLVYFSSTEITLPVFDVISKQKAFVMGLVIAIGFMIVMGWVQFQRRVGQYSAVSSHVLKDQQEKI